MRRHLYRSLLLIPFFIVPAGIARAGGPPTSAQPAVQWRPLIAAPNVTGLGIDNRGNLATSKWAYAVDYLDHTVIKFGTGGRRLLSWRYAAPTPFKMGAGVAVGGSGNVFVADADHGAVVKFDPYGHMLARWTGFDVPNAIALDRAGNIFITESPQSRITKLSPGGPLLAHFSTPWVGGTGSSLPSGVGVAPDGTIYVSARCRSVCPPPHGIQDAILRLDRAGAYQGILLGGNPYAPAQPGEQPWVSVNSMAVDAHGDLYASVDLRPSLANTLVVYRGGLVLSQRIPLPQKAPASAIAVSRNGTILVAANGRIWSRP
jgi:DNA-binding beta-propeller fold protein YncE